MGGELNANNGNRASTTATSSEEITVTSGETSLNGVANYLLPRVAASAGLASAFGASLGYYVGDALIFNFYTYGFTFGLIGTTFFGTNYILRSIRNADDVPNFVASGCLNGALVGAVRGYRRSAVGFVAGGLFGAAYKVSSDVLYTASRESWVRSRRHTIHNSRPRILVSRRDTLRNVNEKRGGSTNSNSALPTKEDKPNGVP